MKSDKKHWTKTLFLLIFFIIIFTIGIGSFSNQNNKD